MVADLATCYCSILLGLLGDSQVYRIPIRTVKACESAGFHQDSNTEQFPENLPRKWGISWGYHGSQRRISQGRCPLVILWGSTTIKPTMTWGYYNDIFRYRQYDIVSENGGFNPQMANLMGKLRINFWILVYPVFRHTFKWVLWCFDSCWSSLIRHGSSEVSWGVLWCSLRLSMCLSWIGNV